VVPAKLRDELSPRDTGAVLLSYSHKRPLLRLIDVDAAEVLPVPTKLDRLGYGLDRVVERDGFFAFAPNISTALLRSDFSVEPLVIKNVGWPAPALAEDHVWISPYDKKESSRGCEAREVDANGNVLRSLTTPPRWSIVGELTGAFVVSLYGTVGLWRPGTAAEPFKPEASLIAVRPPEDVIVASSDGLRVYDGSGTVTRKVEMQLPDPMWKLACAGASRDGRYVVIDIGYTDRLRYCDLDRGTAVPVTGTFDNFCYPPVFSRSGRHVFLGVPFEKRVLGFGVDALTLAEVSRPKKRITAMPLLDIGYRPAIASVGSQKS
jgi:hypothetical protein